MHVGRTLYSGLGTRLDVTPHFENSPHNNSNEMQPYSLCNECIHDILMIFTAEKGMSHCIY